LSTSTIGLAQLPAADVEALADRFLDHIAAVLDGEVPVAGMNVEEPDIVVAILRGKAPGTTARFAGIEDANVVSLLDATQFFADRIEYIERDHRASFLWIDLWVEITALRRSSRAWFRPMVS
jgi:hypothetical protein